MKHILTPFLIAMLFNGSAYAAMSKEELLKHAGTVLGTSGACPGENIVGYMVFEEMGLKLEEDYKESAYQEAMKVETKKIMEDQKGECARLKKLYGPEGTAIKGLFN